jgi:hypothetical protein
VTVLRLRVVPAYPGAFRTSTLLASPKHMLAAKLLRLRTDLTCINMHGMLL